MIKDAAAYRMHKLFNKEGWKVQPLADRFNMTKGEAQKILSGESQPNAYKKFFAAKPLVASTDYDEEMPW